MDIELIQFSIVLVANDHNPSLINPDFLERTGIIDKEWGWKPKGDLITTPPFATVPYDSGVTITVETNKLQVVDQSGAIPTRSRASSIIIKYIDELPHIPYQAIGINFNGAVKRTDSGEYLKKHFLKIGKWDTEESPLQSVGLKLVYDFSECRVVLGLDQAHKAGDKREEAILASGNFHRDCDNSKSANEQISDFVGNIEGDWGYYQNLVSNALEEDS